MNAKRFVLATLPGDPERNALLLADWDFVMVGETGAVMTRENEIHCVGTGLTRARAKEFLLPLIERYGWVKTVVDRGNRRSALIVKRLGFKPVGISPAGTIYKLEGGTKCLQSPR